MRCLGALVLAAFALGACARYEPAPLNTPLQMSAYRARRLDDPALLDWVRRWAGAVAPAGWTARQLAIAALEFRAEPAVARAEWRRLQAGERAAGARPAPGASAEVERAVSGDDGQSPWVVALSGLFSIELGGKRGARLQEARAQTTVAEAELTAVALQIVTDTREAAFRVSLADSARALAARELTTMLQVDSLERERFAEGAVTAAERFHTEAEVAAVRSTVATAARDRITSRAALASALSVPPRSTDSLAVEPASSRGCEQLASMAGDSLETTALNSRPEVIRAIAEYAVSEAQLRLRVARQYPDLDLGPGFIWDQGVHRWTIALALPGLLAFRNQAPIREGEAARRVASARVLQAQEVVLRELTRSGEACRGARIMIAAADSQLVVAERNLARARAAYERGETSRLDAALSELAVVRGARLRFDAESELRLAGLSLEAAAGSWGESTAHWPDPRNEPDHGGAPR